MTWVSPRFAVIPTLGRPCLKQCLEAIQPQVDFTILIHAPAHDEVLERPEKTVLFYVSPLEKRNISRWWNTGIYWAKEYIKYNTTQVTTWDVAVLNDDVIVPPDWFDKLSGRMRQMNVAAAAMGPVPLPILHTKPGTTRLDQRMAGFAFVLAGELGVRADETLEWWCGDNDIDMQSRMKGGTVILPGAVKHLYPDQTTTGELAAQTAVDMQRFVDKWGFRPW